MFRYLLLTCLFSFTVINSEAAPDCSQTYRFSNRNDGNSLFSQQTITSIPGTSPVYDNRVLGCTSWSFSYDSEGFSAVSIQLEDAPAGNGVAGAFVAFAGTVLSGSNPSTATTSATYIATGYFPYIRVNLASLTGTGSINVTLIGYKAQATLATLNGTNSFTNAVNSIQFNAKSGTNKIVTVDNGDLFGGVKMVSSVSYGWSNSTTNSQANADTGLWRISAGLVGISKTTGTGSGGGINLTTLLMSTTLFASLGTPASGTFFYCSDCTIANPCAGSGTGAFAKRLNSIWVCN